MSHILTPQQEAIVKAYREGESFAIRAVAGAAKTTTLVASFQFAGPSTLALAFNKRNAEDLQKKMPATVICKTMNALGHAAWLKHIGRRASIDTSKLFKLWQSYPSSKEFWDEMPDILKLVRVAKAQGLASGACGLGPPDMEKWQDLADEYDITEAEKLLPLAAWLLKRNCEEAFQGNLDFDDQIYMPVMYGSPFPRFACVGVDEAQDLSALQHKMVTRSLAPKAQLVIVGDPNQGIYWFRGASASSFSDLREQFSLRELALTKSFRCPRAVVREARTYVPDMEAAGETEGSVLRTESEPQLALRRTILCRYNAPLIDLAFKGLKQRLSINFLGRDFTAGIKTLNKKHPSLGALASWRADKLAKAKNDSQRQRTEDRFESLSILHEAAKAEGSTVELEIEKLMGVPKAEACTLSTIHKAKGLEWQDVTYLYYKEKPKGGQEENIKYVGVTRSQHTLRLHMKDRW